MRMRSTYTDSRTHTVLSFLPGTARMATRSTACRPVPGLPATDGPARTRRGIREGANSKLGIQRTGAGDTLYTTRVRQRGVINNHAELDDSNTWRACDGTPGATSTTQGCRYGRALLLGVLGKLLRGDKPDASVGGLRMMSLQDRLKHVTPTAYGVRINMLRRSGMRVDDMLEDGQQEFHNEQAVKGERPQIQHSATGQDESWWQSWSWDAPSATGQDESWDDSHQQSWSWKHWSSDSRSSNDWGASANGATEYGQRPRRPTGFPDGDSRITEHRKNKRICVCDACGIRIAFGTRTMEFDGRFVDESWRGTMHFHELYNAWKRGDIDARWWCSVCHNGRGGADLDETRRVLGIAWRDDSRMARAAAWRAGRY